MTDISPRKAQILLVEDNPADVYLLRRALNNAGAECDLTVLEDGAEALAFVRKQGAFTAALVPDLIVLDLNLPKNGGLDVLQAMVGENSLTGVPVAILTSSSSPRERAAIAEFGVQRYIIKPPDLTEFMKIGVLLKELLDKS